MKALTPKDIKHIEEAFAHLTHHVTLIYFTEAAECRYCRRERELLAELTDLSHKLHLEVYNFTADRDAVEKYGIDKIPGLIIAGKENYGVRYYGMPSDIEFRMLLDDIMRVSAGDSGLSANTIKSLAKLKQPVHLEVLSTPTCPFSSGAGRLAHQLAMEKDNITADLVNLDDFPEIMEHYNITAAPTVIVNGNNRFYGAIQETDFVEQVLKTVQNA